MAMAVEQERIQFRCSKALRQAADEAGRRSGGISGDQYVRKLLERIFGVPDEDFWVPDGVKLDPAKDRPGPEDSDGSGPLQPSPKRGRTHH